MKEIQRRANRILMIGAALSLVGGILLAPFFADAGFFDKAKEEDVSLDVGCSDDEITYSYGGEYYCVDTANCSSDAECGAGEMCLVQKGTPIKKVDVKTGETVTRIPSVASCEAISSIDSLCKTNADCKAKAGKDFDLCKTVSPPQWPGGYFLDAQCVKTPIGAKGCCTLSSDGLQYKDKTEAECLSLAGSDPAQMLWQVGACPGTPGSGGTGSGVCSSDKDCLNNLICGGASVVGTSVQKKCVALRSLSGGAQCVADSACVSEVCDNKDAKTGVGQCTVDAAKPVDLGKFTDFTKESCESKGGEWVAGAGKDGKGACYAKAPPIALVTEIGGKTQVKGLGDYLLTVFNVGMALGAGFAVLMVMIGGFMYMVSGGNPSSVTKAKQYGISAVTGLVLILFSYLLFNTINPALVKMKPIAMPMVASLGMTCCVKGTTPQFMSGEKCPAGWKAAKDIVCTSGMALNSPCCVDKTKPGNSENCHKIGGVCILAEKMDKNGPCTKIAEGVGFTAATGVVGGVLTASAGKALLSTAAKYGWKATQLVGKGVVKGVILCAKNPATCLVGAAGVGVGFALTDLLDGESCAEENVGVCMEANVKLSNGDMCKDDKQCGSGICCMTMDSLGCWGGGSIGFCSNGQPGKIADGSVGTCKLEDPKGICCKPTDSNGKTVVCAAAKVGLSTLGYCSSGQEGHACGKFTGGGWLTGYTYETATNICEKGLKCNDAGICVSELQTEYQGAACKSDEGCPKNAFCATLGKWFCKTEPGGKTTGIKDAVDQPGCIVPGKSAVNKCFVKVQDGKDCVTDSQCLSGSCADNVCEVTKVAGEECVNDANCGAGLVCLDSKCVEGNKAGGAECSENKECQYGLCVKCSGANCAGVAKICTYGAAGSTCAAGENCEKGLQCLDGKCKLGAEKGEPCNTNTDCISGNCNYAFNNTCGPSPVGTACEDDADCEGKVCNTALEPDTCGPSPADTQCSEDKDCASGMCNTALSPDKCAPNGGYKENGHVCIPGQDAMCGAGWSCIDTVGLNGECSDGSLQSLCETDEDCHAGLVCPDIWGTNICVKPPQQ